MTQYNRIILIGTLAIIVAFVGFFVLSEKARHDQSKVKRPVISETVKERR